MIGYQASLALATVSNIFSSVEYVFLDISSPAQHPKVWFRVVHWRKCFAARPATNKNPIYIGPRIRF